MTIENILKRVDPFKRCQLNYAGSITQFESVPDCYYECDAYDLLDEQAEYHITKNVVYIIVK